jgi:hypothetical protein
VCVAEFVVRGCLSDGWLLLQAGPRAYLEDYVAGGNNRAAVHNPSKREPYMPLSPTHYGYNQIFLEVNSLLPYPFAQIYQ